MPGWLWADIDVSVKDVNGNVITQWDDLLITENIPWSSLKRGDKVKNVRLIDGDRGNIEGKVDGVQWVIKTKYVKLNKGKKKK